MAADSGAARVDVDRESHRLPPPWLGHLLVFGLLFALVLAWFFVQTRQAERAFQDDAGEHARLLADAVILHARGALLAEDVMSRILIRFLGQSARFAEYLDGIAPFRTDELSAFAAEAGLSVIHIRRAEGTVQGPADWASAEPLDCARLERLIRLPEAHTILFGVAASQGEGCVLVGLDSRHTEALEAAVGLPRALASVAALPGVISVRLLGDARVDIAPSQDAGLPRITLGRATDGRLVAQASAPVAGAELRLELDASPLQRMRTRLWWEFLVFVLALVLTGSAGTWVLYRHQRAHERQRLGYERRLSRQREEAGLGRAAAAIAHEIRNPLNAMAMGLQRLQMEADELTPEHCRLLELVREAVQRTNGTVTGLLDYARPIQPRRVSLALDALIVDQLSLYAPAIAKAGIHLEPSLSPGSQVFGDPDLLRHVLDNLLRNALEASPAGGVLRIGLTRVEDETSLTLENDGLALPAGEVERILEPWFTTKTLGTGLGLAISRRIVSAHGGRLLLEVPRPGRLRLTVVLPARPSD
ncbi:ATP-binding protein [uncultured Thiocystis sp.]|uniref:sensor histidine kinase n=1 Tax=uncultured Thiocystis sp. TaxID=1202134 RepID=UPI0025FEBB00|nr:ATP-binding protein [uncultured Thiocystis sp.]